jgi:hypothetical protein
MLSYCRLLILVALVGLNSPATAMAEGQDVDFFGTVLEIDMESATEGTLTVRLMGSPVSLNITGDTEIEGHGDELGLDDLSVGDFVKVSGVFSNSAITANEIEIIDGGEGEFRLRGTITAVTSASGGKVIKVLGVDVLVNSETKIQRRGPAGGFTADNLAAGMVVDTRGESVDDQLVARRLKVGVREDDAIRVDFTGKITAVEPGKLTLDTEGGSSAVVLIGADTMVVGTPEAGKFAMVRGTLNSALEVAASRVIVRGERKSADAPSGPASVDFKKEIELTSSAAGSRVRAEASIGVSTKREQTEQTFELKVLHAGGSAEYKIVVEIGSAQVDFVTFTTNRGGVADVRLSTSPKGNQQNLQTLLPAGKTVRDFVSVKVMSGTTVVLQGTF